MKRWMTVVWVAACAAALLAGAAWGQQEPPFNVRRVDINTPAACSAQNGQSWGTAYRYLQDGLEALDLDLGIDTLWVAVGTYYPDVFFNSSCVLQNTNQEDSTFDLEVGFNLFGGFPTGGGGLEGPEQRNPALFEQTVLSGDLRQNDLPDSFLNHGENSWHVVSVAIQDDEDPSGAETIHVDGFKITGGNADNPNLDEVFRNIDEVGGGVLIDASINGDLEAGPSFRNCLIRLNRSQGVGGGIGTTKMGVFLLRCRLEMNEAASKGLVWTGELFGGGGASVLGPLNAFDCAFTDNVAHPFGDNGAGGGLEVQDKAVIVDCEFRENTAATSGGGVAVVGDAEFTNSLFYKNVANGTTERGGGLHVTGIGTIYNCTLVENEAAGLGGGANLQAGGTVWNSIFWNNVGSSGAAGDWEDQQVFGSECVYYSLIEDFPSDYACNCVIPCADTSIPDPPDPEFSDQAHGDLHLAPDSPAIDVGNPDDGQLPEPCRAPSDPSGIERIRCDDQDLDGDGITSPPEDPLADSEPTPDLDINERVLVRIDMGVYEYFDCLGDICGGTDGSPDGVVGINDLLCLLAAWGPCPSPPNPCPADICSPFGTVGINDLLCLLANWGCPVNGVSVPASANDCMNRYMPDIEKTVGCITGITMAGGG